MFPDTAMPRKTLRVPLSPASPSLSDPLENLRNYLILRDCVLIIVSLSCLKGHDPCSKSGEIPGVSAQQAGEIFQPLMRGRSHGAPRSLSTADLNLLGGCPHFGKVALLNGPIDIH